MYIKLVHVEGVGQKMTEGYMRIRVWKWSS